MPASVAQAVNAATTEWNGWGRSSWNCINGQKSSGFRNDDESERAQYILDHYVSLIYSPPITWPTKALISGDNYAWSAVTISYFMAQGGFARKPILPNRVAPTAQQLQAWAATSQADQFPISQAHADYIRWAIQARKANVAGASYWGYRVDEAAAVPEVGDIIGCSRSGQNLSTAQRLAYFERTGAYDSHTDLVVAKRPGEIDVIGGNVRDSVTKKTLALNAAGQLIDTTFPWFVVMKHRP
jgi:hypothetical protein